MSNYLNRILKFPQTIFATLLRKPTLTESEKQLRLNFISRILPVIVPILLFIQISRIFISEETASETIFSSVAYITTVISIYFVVKTNRYTLTISYIYILGSALIISNALASQPPHIEILYLLILPLVASMILSIQETVYWSVITSIVMFVFSHFLIEPSSENIYTDVIHMTIVFNTFILFVGYQRYRLEQDRQSLTLVSERNQMLRFLLNSISHDIRTPLSVINSSTYLLRKTLTDNYQTHRLDKIETQTQLLNEMVENIFLLSKLEYADKNTVVHSDLVEITQQTLESLTPQIEQKQIMLKTRFEPDVKRLAANPDDLQTAVHNLLKNAIQFNRVGGEIHVNIYQEGGKLNLCIQDTGQGISTEDLPLIASPFFRVDRNRSGNDANSGLGLTLVHKIVDLYGGRIEFTSEVDKGTKVEVFFPVK